MKWFKHHSDSYSNLKHQQMIAEFGVEAYGFFWVCVELVAQQGTNSRIKSEKSWKKVLSHITGLTPEKSEKFLNGFAATNLIDEKGLEIGDLYIPKIRDYSDEYTDKIRRMSRHSRDNVVLDKIRIDKNRIEENTLYPFDSFWKIYPNKVNKKKTYDKWEKIGDESKKLIMDDLPKRIMGESWMKDGGKFIPHPTTYLNGERWNDEIKVASRKGEAIFIK